MKKELEEVAQIFNMQTQFLRNDDQFKLLKNKIALVVQEIKFQQPYFSAAGFMEVNYAIFLYIFSGAASFVAAYYQLSNKWK